MINSYYLLIDGEKTGPYTQYELMDMELDVHTMVLSPLAGDEEWQEASDLPEFNNYFHAIGIYLPTPANLASFWWRLLAYLIDYVTVIMIAIVLFVIFFTIQALLNGSLPDDGSEQSEALYNLLGIVCMTFYHSICEATPMQGGVGKKICKLVVVDANGRRISFVTAFRRNISKLLSSLILGIGFLNVLWDSHRQAWHDQIAKTYIVKTDR